MPNNRNKWKLHEKVVATIEKFICPDANVEHNKFLPVIGRSYRKARQCDIVITNKVGIRNFITIVEVQKRNKKPEITQFHGWIRKMEEVGAQHLICVSELGFPDSIINEVKYNYGSNRVSLMSLKELNLLEGNELINIIVPYQIHTTRKFEIVSVEEFSIKAPKDSGQKSCSMDFNPDERCFSQDGVIELNSLNELISKRLNTFSEQNQLSNDEIIKIHFIQNDNLSFYLGYERFQVQSIILNVKILMKRNILPIEGAKFVYSQEILNDTLVWVIKTKLLLDGVLSDIDILIHFKIEGPIINLRESQRII